VTPCRKLRRYSKGTAVLLLTNYTSGTCPRTGALPVYLNIIFIYLYALPRLRRFTKKIDAAAREISRPYFRVLLIRPLKTQRIQRIMAFRRLAYDV